MFKRFFFVSHDVGNFLFSLCVQARFVFELLDFEQKGTLDVLDFLHIAEVLKIRLKDINREWQKKNDHHLGDLSLSGL